MSSYAFETDQDGPPGVSPLGDGGCNAAWICEHRRAVQVRMIEFREATAGADLVNWRIIDDVVSFGRGEIGHIAINTGASAARVHLPTSLPPGRYAGLVNGATVIVDSEGMTEIVLDPLSFVAVLRENQAMRTIGIANGESVP
jgi:hypothetical protein